MAVLPLLENYPIYFQLWSLETRQPGQEFSLSTLTNRNLTIEFLNGASLLHTASENDANPIVKVENAARGLLSLRLDSTAWAKLAANKTYVARISAYGAVRGTEMVTVGSPDSGSKSINGVQLYCSPSNILEILGAIPGAVTQTSVDLSDRWIAPNAQGYWTLTLTPPEKIWGLWVDRVHAMEVEYDSLATGPSRCWAQVGNTIYYKGPEKLDRVESETAFSRFVLTQIQYASDQVEDFTNRKFGQWRVFREVHNGLNSDRQLFSRDYPLIVDEWFRLDAFGSARDFSRRYTEADVSTYPNTQQREKLHVDGATGAITINQSLFAFGRDFLGGYGDSWFGASRLPVGQNNIELTYSFGPSKPHVSIQEATAKLAAIKLLNYWERTMAQGMDGASLGCVNLKFADARPYMERWKAEAEEAIDKERSHLVEPY